MDSRKANSEFREILTAEPVAVHTFNNGWKRFRDIGKLIAYDKTDGTFWLNVNHGTRHELLKDEVFHKLVYENYTSYLKEAIRGGFVAVSFENSSPSLRGWEDFIRKFGKIEDFGKGLQDLQFRRKIDYHCPDVQKSSIHSCNMLTPMYQWGGKIQDSIYEKHEQVFKGGSNREGLAQKTKRLLRNSWRAFTTKVKETKETISEKLHSNEENRINSEPVEGPSKRNRKNRTKNETEVA